MLTARSCRIRFVRTAETVPTVFIINILWILVCTPALHNVCQWDVRKGQIERTSCYKKTKYKETYQSEDEGQILWEVSFEKTGQGFRVEVTPTSSRGTSLWQWNSTLSNQRSAKGEGVHNALVGQEGHFSVKMGWRHSSRQPGHSVGALKAQMDLMSAFFLYGLHFTGIMGA